MMIFTKSIPIDEDIVDHYFNKITVRLNKEDSIDSVVSVKIVSSNGDWQKQPFHYDCLLSKLTIVPSQLTHRIPANMIEIEYQSLSEERDLKIKEIIG